jgi:hypothetical protein
MATSLPGYGAIPPQFHATAPNTISNNAIQFGMPNSTVTFTNDGEIVTAEGAIKINDLIVMVTIFKKLVVELSQDRDVVKKYPYIQDLAHTWLIEELSK